MPLGSQPATISELLPCHRLLQSFVSPYITQGDDDRRIPRLPHPRPPPSPGFWCLVNLQTPSLPQAVGGASPSPAPTLGPPLTSELQRLQTQSPSSCCWRVSPSLPQGPVPVRPCSLHSHAPGQPTWPGRGRDSPWTGLWLRAVALLASEVFACGWRTSSRH